MMTLQILIIILTFPYVGKLTVIYRTKATQCKMQNGIVLMGLVSENILPTSDALL